MNYREALEHGSEDPDRGARVLRTAAVLSEALAEAGSLPVLVGGGAVEIYTRSAYTTHDLDFVAAQSEALDRTMMDLGFEREGRHWLNPLLGLAVEFPATTLGQAESVSLDVDGLRLEVIAVEDLIVDRLASWKHWRWNPDAAAAVLLLALHRDLDEARLQHRARAEDVSDALELLRVEAEAESELTEEKLERIRAQLAK